MTDPVKPVAHKIGVDKDGRPLKGIGSWSKRRLFMYLVNAFCAWVIIYCLWNRLDTRVAETAVMMAFGVMGASTGAYVFGAVWDDRNKMELLGMRPGDEMGIPPSAVVDRPLH